MDRLLGNDHPWLDSDNPWRFENTSAAAQNTTSVDISIISPRSLWIYHPSWTFQNCYPYSWTCGYLRSCKWLEQGWRTLMWSFEAGSYVNWDWSSVDLIHSSISSRCYQRSGPVKWSQKNWQGAMSKINKNSRTGPQNFFASDGKTVLDVPRYGRFWTCPKLVVENISGKTGVAKMQHKQEVSVLRSSDADFDKCRELQQDISAFKVIGSGLKPKRRSKFVMLLQKPTADSTSLTKHRWSRKKICLAIQYSTTRIINLPSWPKYNLAYFWRNSGLGIRPEMI